MAMAVLGPFGKRAHVSMEQYAAAAEPEPPVEAPPVEAPESVVDVEAPTVADTAEAPSVAAPKDEEETEWGPVLEWVVVR
jgi:hypothetical protein